MSRETIEKAINTADSSACVTIAKAIADSPADSYKHQWQLRLDKESPFSCPKG